MEQKYQMREQLMDRIQEREDKLHKLRYQLVNEQVKNKSAVMDS